MSLNCIKTWPAQAQLIINKTQEKKTHSQFVQLHSNK